MKRVKNLAIGGIETKIFNLILITVLLVSAIFLLVTLNHGKILSQLTEETGQRQRESIASTTGAVMDQVVEKSMARTLKMQAAASDEMFSNLEARVRILCNVAAGMLSDPAVSAADWEEPDPSLDGQATAQMLLAPGVRAEQLEDRLGVVANMGDLMEAMFAASEQTNSCFIALPEGAVLVVDDRPSEKYDETGNLISFDPRNRPWYELATAAGSLIFTDVETDAFTGDVGIVCAMPVYVNGELTAVVGSDLFLTTMHDAVQSSTEDGGFLCVVNQHGHVVFSPREEGDLRAVPSEDAVDLRHGENKELGNLIADAVAGRTDLRKIMLEDGVYYMMGAPLETVGWTLLSAYSVEAAGQPEAQLQQNYARIEREAIQTYRGKMTTVNITGLILVLAMLLLTCLAALIIGKRIVRPLNKITNRIAELKEGNLEFKMDDAYRTGDEIQILAESFSELSHKTLEYVEHVRTAAAEKERIGTELEMATRIQSSMMPHVFPAFPDRTEFVVYASMDPAKEVGGDFYDFFLIDEDHLCLAIADVSGKGVPAALFMMACKIILQSIAMMGNSPAEILTRANEAICSNNQEEMFISVWLGILEISTGKLIAANAGHEYPALMKPDGRFEIFRDKHGLVIGAMEGIHYKEYEVQMQPGSRLFIYTDGVPEAVNEKYEMFGLDRLMTALNKVRDASPEDILAGVSRDINRFVMGAEQFDDITMLCVEYKGNEGDDHE